MRRPIKISRRDGVRRLADLVLETTIRLEQICLRIHEDFDFPADQREPADLTGMTSVHVSRCLGELKSRGLIHYSHGKMHIAARPGLTAFAGFEQAFLKLDIDGLKSIDAPTWSPVGPGACERFAG